MADLIELDRAGAIKIAGANPATGITDNYLDVDINGFIGSRLYTATGSSINFGQSTMTGSLPVTFASDQSALPITAASLPLPTGAATSALQTTGNTSLSTIATTLTLAQGSATSGQTGNLILAAVTAAAPTYSTGQSSPLSLTTGGLLRVDASGAIVQSAQSGVWTVQPGNTANTTAWFVKDNSLGTVAAGTAGTQSSLAGGVFNTALPTLTNGQQAALQLDSSGRLIISPATQTITGTVSVSNLPATVDTNYGTVGASTLRTASQIGNATGAALFGAGTTTAQVLRVVLPTDQTAIPVSQSATWTVQPGNTANTTPWLVTDSSDGPVTPGTVAGKSSLAGGQYNSSLPTLTTGQQVSLQVDVNGRLLISGSFALSNDTNYGTVGASTLRTAAQVGNATGGADFNAGATGAQTLRTVANQGAPNTAANGWFTKVTDGTNTAAVKAASTAAVATDPSLVIAISPNSPIPTGSNVIGSVNQASAPWQFVGNIASGSADSGNPLKIGGVFNTTQPTVTTGQRVDAQMTARGSLIIATGVDPLNINNITGTISLPTGAATSANQSLEVTSLQLIDNIVGSGPAAGAAATNSALIGAVFNTALPTLTNGQQAALQLDSSGRLIISPATQTVTGTVTVSNFPTTVDTNYGTVGASTIRTASQVGNATGAAAFGAGVTSAQVLRVVLPTDQTAIPVSQSATWTVQPGNTANTTPWLVTDSSDGPVTPGTVAGKSSLAGGQFNTALPTLTTGQQASIQLDSSGRLIVSPTTQGVLAEDHNYGTVGATTLRTASQVGNATGAALFGAGTTTAQVLRVVLPTDQTGINTFLDKTGSGTITALAQSVTATTNGCSSVSFNVTGTWTATLIIEATNDGGTTWNTTNGNIVALDTSTQFFSTNAFLVVPCGSFGQVRLRASAFSSGTANITWEASSGANVVPVFNNVASAFNAQVVGNIASGSADSGNPVKVGGIFNTTLPTLTNAQRGDLQLDSSARVIISPNFTMSYDSYSPDTGNFQTGPASLNTDGAGRLETHSTVLTDEGSLRDDFTGTSLTSNITGTGTFVNGSTAVTGSGTAFTTQVKVGQYIGRSVDSILLWGQVQTIISDTSLTLISGYGGTGGSSTTAVGNWIVSSPGTGGTITVATSLVNLASGTGVGTASLIRSGDYLPYNMYGKFSISQRIVNQTINFGFVDVFPTPSKQAVFQFSGTTNTQVICQTSFSSAAADTQTLTVTLPGGVTTAASNRYEIDLTGNQCTFFVNGIIVAQFQDHLPGPYDSLQIFAGITNNATAASSTTVAVDYIYFSNVDQVEITTNFSGEALPVNGNVPSGNTDFGSPVKIGGVFNTALPTLTTGQRGDIQLDSSGRLIISPITLSNTSIVKSQVQDNAGNGITSTASAGTTTSKQSLDVTVIPGALNYYSAPVNIRQTAATAANSTVWTMRNAAASTKTVYIERITLLMAFDTATPITRSLQRYDLVRFSAATPTAGTAITVVSMDSSNAATGVTDVRFVDTGLTTTGVTFGAAFATIACPATDATTTQFSRDGIALKLAPGEGFCIRLTVAAVAGQSVAGEVVWSER